MQNIQYVILPRLNSCREQIKIIKLNVQNVQNVAKEYYSSRLLVIHTALCCVAATVALLYSTRSATVRVRDTRSLNILD